MSASSSPAGVVTSAAIVSVGDELLSGSLVDRNAAQLAARLLELDLPVGEVRVLGDDERALAGAIVELSLRHGLVVVSGGLGPTLDDVTRHAAARAAGVALESDPQAQAHLERTARSQGRALSPCALRQALFPAGSVLLENPVGTAPGFLCSVGQSTLACLPGPPHELSSVLETSLLPALRARLCVDRAHARGQLYLFGLTESELAERLGQRMRRDAEPLVGVTASEGILRLTVAARASAPERARERLEATLAELREELGPLVYSSEEPQLERVLGRELIDRGLSVALAESCTGGLAASLLARVPGISSVLREAFVTYTDESKTRALGVDAELIAEQGAVSAPVAGAMARAAAERSGARLAVSITGFAGPAEGVPDESVGLVHFGLWAHGRLSTQEERFAATRREAIQRRAANTALAMLLRAARNTLAD